MAYVFEAIGALGLLCIVAGVVVRDRKTQNIFYIIGGAILTAYSLHIANLVFVLLQLVFIAAALYDLLNSRKATLPRR